MNTLAQNQKVVKGLSIAAIVISALAIIFSLVMVFTASATLAYVNETVEQYSSLSSYYSSYYYGYVDPDELAAMSFAATAMVVLAVLAVISGGFQLFVSIFIFLKHKDTAKLKTLFVLAIIAAVASLVVGGIVNIVHHPGGGRGHRHRALRARGGVHLQDAQSHRACSCGDERSCCACSNSSSSGNSCICSGSRSSRASSGDPCTRSSRAGSSTNSYASRADGSACCCCSCSCYAHSASASRSWCSTHSCSCTRRSGCAERSC